MPKTNISSTQFELFPEGSKQDLPPSPGNLNPRKIVCSLENVVGACILLVVAGVVCFCMGVKKGQTEIVVDPSSPKIYADNSDESAIIVRSNEEKVEILNISQVVEEVPPVALAEEETEKIEVLSIELPPEIIEEAVYTIQVASFIKETTAKKEAGALEKKGYETSIMQKGKHSIVCVGKFSERHEAKSFSKRLKNKYKDCLVRRL